MFEPMPSMIRRERERQELTLEELADMADVSRSRLSALERGEENVSFAFVLKVANALGMKELRASGLRIAGAAPDLTVLVAAMDALEMARRIVDQAASSAADLDRMSAKVSTLLDRTLSPMADPGISQAAERLVARDGDKPTSDALRELAKTTETSRPVLRKQPAQGGAKRRAR
jgi:transcriptional regulator with XRE-family HTH domain